MSGNPLRPRRAGRRGVSLFLAILVVATLSVMAMVALRVATDDVDIALADLDGAQALLAAESGIAHGAAALAADPRFLGTVAGTIELTLDPDVTDPFDRYAFYSARTLDRSGDGTPDAIESVGACRGQSRALAAELRGVNPVEFAGRPREIPAPPPAP